MEIDQLDVFQLADLPHGGLIEAPPAREREPMGCSAGAAPSSFSLEQHLIMRFLDDDVAQQVRKWLKTPPQPDQAKTADEAEKEGQEKDQKWQGVVDGKLKIKLDSDLRNATVHVEGHGTLVGKIVDLPSIIETQKTKNGYLFHKSGSISQMLICAKNPQVFENLNEDYLYNHGISPPFHNIRKKRFRIPVQKNNENYYVDSEVKRLLMHDKNALSYEWEVLNENDEEGSEMVNDMSQMSPGGLPSDSEFGQEDSMSGSHASPTNSMYGPQDEEIFNELENDLIGDISSSSTDGDDSAKSDEENNSLE